MVILDTNIIIDHLRQPSKKSKLRELEDQFPNESFAVSIVTIQELYEGKSTRSRIEEKNLLDIISSFKILPYDYELSVIAGQLARDLDRKIEFPDAAIAATAILNKAKFFTLNKKDFQGIEKLKLI